MLGAHMSIAGGLHNALLEARRFDTKCVQVFTKNQRQWSAPPLTEEQIRIWNEHRRSTGIDAVVSHDSYLINLASPKQETRKKSIALFRDEIERCEALAIPHHVVHPGSHMKAGEDEGIERIVDALDRVHDELPGYETITCLENTAGQGTSIGHDLDHLRRIIEGVKEPERLAVCIDTAHALAAGYGLTSATGARRFLRAVDQKLGLHLVKAMHLNDSKAPLGARVDRHEHIGHGYVASEAFNVLLRRRALRNAPGLLETPKDTAPDGREWDEVNLEALRTLAASPVRGGAS